MSHDPDRQRYLAVAVSANPKRTAYSGVKTSIWTCPEGGSKWICLAVYDNVHSDALGVWREHIWLPDQLSDRLLALNADTGAVEHIFSGDALDFPHGVAVSPTGVVTVTNYGSSSVVLADADRLTGQAA